MVYRKVDGASLLTLCHLKGPKTALVLPLVFQRAQSTILPIDANEKHEKLLTSWFHFYCLVVFLCPPLLVFNLIYGTVCWISTIEITLSYSMRGIKVWYNSCLKGLTIYLRRCFIHLFSKDSLEIKMWGNC